MKQITWILRRILPLLLPTCVAAQTAEQHFIQLCAPCHAADATGTDRGPSLTNSRAIRSRTDAEIHDAIRNGTQRDMPPFPLPETQLQSLTRYVLTHNHAHDAPNHPGDPAPDEHIFLRTDPWHTGHKTSGHAKT